MKEQLIEQVRDVVVGDLQEQVREALIRAADAIMAREGLQSDSPRIHENLDSMCRRFAKFLALDFDSLVKPSGSRLSIMEGTPLTLADDADMQVANMLDGMIAYCRNLHMKEYMAFTSRFGALFYDNRVDETNNPLDPEQICRAFSDCLIPLKLAPRHQHQIYQQFNQLVLNKLGATLEKANQVLVEMQVKPSLDVYVRNRDTVFGKRKGKRPESNPAERAFDLDSHQHSIDSEASLSELFAIVRRCLGGAEPAGKGSALSQLLARNEHGQLLALPASPLAGKVAGESVIPDSGLVTLRVPTGKTLGVYSIRRMTKAQLLASLSSVHADQPAAGSGKSAGDQVHPSLLELVCDGLLAQKKASVLSGLDPEVGRDVEILSLFYQAIDEDAALAAPFKSLVSRTRVAALKLALGDADFFSRDTHSLATLINEIGDIGFGWTDSDRLRDDATFNKLETLVNKLDSAEAPDDKFVGKLFEELNAYRTAIPEETAEFSEQQNRVQLVRRIARQKLQERIVSELDPVVDEILNTHFQNFMEKLLLREGAGGSSWKYVIETVDKLLWTLQMEKDPADQSLFEKINPRIMSNLKKVLSTAGVSEDRVRSLLDQLSKLQLEAFENAERSDRDATAKETARQVFDDARSNPDESRSVDHDQYSRTVLADNSEYLKQVDKLPIGTWVEFTVPGEPPMRCTLAGRMVDGGEFYFVSRHGVKMIEKSRSGLARELKDGSVRIVGEWPLFNRTLETVIASLRNQSTEQRAAP